MKRTTLVLRGLAFHARAHAATLLGVTLASAVLVGALSVGDSVQASLARATELRLGAVRGTVGDGERWFRRTLAAELEQRLGREGAPLQCEALIELPATAARPDGSARTDDVRLFGVGAAFFTRLTPARQGPVPSGDGAWLGRELARRLALDVGDELLLRTERPSAMTRELALASAEDTIRPLRVRVAGVLPDEEGGALALAAGLGPPANVFVDEAWLASRLEREGRVNRLYLAGDVGTHEARISGALAESWQLEDLGLAWLEQENGSELRTDQIFFTEVKRRALLAAGVPVQELVGYFVKGLENGGRFTPYSTVAAVGGASLGGALDGLPSLAPDELVLNEWTARDLAVEVGDTVTLRYDVLGSGRRLEERTADFRVAVVLPTAGAGADPSLMPDFPGIGDAENCRDWDPGFPIDRERLRDVDEEYWDLYRGAPKAFVSLARAEVLFANRFGALTALRVAPGDRGALERALRALPAGELGLPLRALDARVEATSDFGGLFLGLSFFLIVSALLLVGLFFAFSLERRARELGVLRATGFLPREAGALFLGEAAGLAALGAVLGAGLGVLYTRALVAGLEHLWAGALGRTSIHFHVESSSLISGALIAFLCALVAVGLVLRRAARAPLVPLLAGELVAPGEPRRAARRLLALVVLVIGAALLVAALVSSARELGFAAGFVLFLGGLLAVRASLAQARQGARGLLGVGWSNAARRPGRSLVTVARVASGVFLLVVAGASRQGPSARDAGPRAGTGGFDFLGRTSLAVLQSLDSPQGRELYGFEPEELAGTTLVPLRVRAGDEASCLNLDRPRSPRLLGVAPERLAGRFRFARTLEEADEPWSLLERELSDGAEPVVVDAISLQWTLHGKLGGELELLDGEGRPFKARVVGTLAESILQGDVLLSERGFERRFPREAGYRAFLVDAPAASVAALGERLSRALADEGLVLTPTHERLDLLRGVQNTYLAIFQALGGLGLVLGSFGLLALVLRQALERRGELALFLALGFTRRELVALFLGEQGGLVLVGLALGACAGAAAAAPGATSDSLAALVPLAGWIGLTGLLGLLWVRLGAALALRGANLAALNRE